MFRMKCSVSVVVVVLVIGAATAYKLPADNPDGEDDDIDTGDTGVRHPPSGNTGATGGMYPPSAEPESESSSEDKEGSSKSTNTDDEDDQSDTSEANPETVEGEEDNSEKSSSKGKSNSKEGSEGKSNSKEGSEGKSNSKEGSEGKSNSKEGSGGKSSSKEGSGGKSNSKEGSEGKSNSKEGSEGKSNSKEGSEGKSNSKEGSEEHSESQDHTMEPTMRTESSRTEAPTKPTEGPATKIPINETGKPSTTRPIISEPTTHGNMTTPNFTTEATTKKQSTTTPPTPEHTYTTRHTPEHTYTTRHTPETTKPTMPTHGTTNGTRPTPEIINATRTTEVTPPSTQTTTTQTTTTQTTTTERTTPEKTTRRPHHSQWGPWGSWSSCEGLACGYGFQMRYRRCGPAPAHPYEPCQGYSKETRECRKQDVIAIDCEQCELLRGVGYLPSCVHDSVFYQCVLMPDQTFELTQMDCAPCTVWSPQLLTCVRDEDDYFCTDDTQTGGEEPEVIQVVGDRCSIVGSQYAEYKGIVYGDATQYMVYSEYQQFTMPCPAGTLFNLTQCACTHAVTAPQVTQSPVPDPRHCINFDIPMTSSYEWGFMDSGTWVGNHGSRWDSQHVEIGTDGCPAAVGYTNRCGDFNGESYLTINGLANAFHTWSSFTITLWYKAADSSHMGLLTNGLPSCNSLPSVSVMIDSDYVIASVHTDEGTATLQGQGIPSQWNQLTLVKDNDAISLYLNGYKSASSYQTGALQSSHCAMIFGVDQYTTYFTGQMDGICLYDAAVYPTEPVQPPFEDEYFWA